MNSKIGRTGLALGTGRQRRRPVDAVSDAAEKAQSAKDAAESLGLWDIATHALQSPRVLFGIAALIAIGLLIYWRHRDHLDPHDRKSSAVHPRRRAAFSPPAWTMLLADGPPRRDLRRRHRGVILRRLVAEGPPRPLARRLQAVIAKQRIDLEAARDTAEQAAATAAALSDTDARNQEIIRDLQDRIAQQPQGGACALDDAAARGLRRLR